MTRRILQDQSGFTLIEMLIVVILLGILAMIIIPQIGVTTDDAKLNTLRTDLSALRNAVELYYVQHKNTYPGTVLAADGATAADSTTCPAAFLAQLTKWSDASGKTSDTKDLTNFPYGPYIKGGVVPTNPFNDKNTVVCDTATKDITAKDATASDDGWKFYTETGVLMAADGTTDEHGSL